MDIVSPISVGERLLAKGVITREQLEAAQQKQWNEGGEMEEHLVALGFLSEDEMLAFLCDAFHYRYLRLEEVEIDREAIYHVPAAVAHRYGLLPIRRTGNALAVVMMDPLSTEAMISLKRVTDFEIIPFVSDREAIEGALYIHYGPPPPQEGNPTLGREAPDFLLRRRDQLGADRYLQMARSLALERDRAFDTFVRDTSNEFALSVARLIAQDKAEESANPFVCFGQKGVGKSHLLMAMANFVATHLPERRFIFTTGRRFCTEYFEALRENRVNLFRYFYRELDLLLVDDADDLFERSWAQDELYETYRALARNGRWLAMACRADPRTMPLLLPKLKAAMEEGIIGFIGSYSLEARVEILSRRQGGLPIARDLFLYLIKRADGSLEDLLGILEQVMALSITGKKEITPELIDDVLQIMELAEAPGCESYAQAVALSVKHKQPSTEERTE
ncbi:MAG: DnaA/Hda family protein [bacterium]